MKNCNLKLLSLASLFVLVGAIACKKDNDGPSSGLSATIKGTAFQPSIVTGLSDGDEVAVAGIQMKSGDTLTLTFVVPDDTQLNTNIDIYDSYMNYFNNKGTMQYSAWYGDSHGSITVTSWDKSGKKIGGKFSGVLYSGSGNDSVVIANGQFNTTYHQQ